MNVPQTQHSLFRQLDAVGLVAQVQQAAELAQRQLAIDHTRDAQHRQSSVSQAEGAGKSAAVDERDPNTDQRQPRSRSHQASAAAKDADAEIKDAPNISPLGHKLDIVA